MARKEGTLWGVFYMEGTLFFVFVFLHGWCYQCERGGVGLKWCQAEGDCV